jgi:minor extracellular serine protease Vpr
VLAGGMTFPAASGDFATVSSDLTKPLGVVTGTGTPTGLSTACNTNKPAAGSLSGKIALISRGVCTFSEKIRNAQDAGAVAVIVANNVKGDPIAMGLGGIANEPTVPAYMVSQDNGSAMKGLGDGTSTTIKAEKAYLQTGNDNFMAGFSSQGPTDVDFRVKPDAVAPGVNVLSAQPNGSCKTPPCWAFFQGTSMATPHLAGIAAVVKSQHLGWSAAEIRSAVVNTADWGVATTSTGAATTDVNLVGAGRANTASAVAASVALDPVSVSFGAVPSGAGTSDTRTISLSSLGGAATSVTITPLNAANGVVFTATLSGSTITIGMTAQKGIPAGGRRALLSVSSGTTEIAHAAVYTLVK